MTTSAPPAAERIAAVLRGQIERGEVRPGWALPSKSSIRREWGVSNDTAAAVFAQLVGEGLIETRSGAGTFVRAIPRMCGISTLTSGFESVTKTDAPAPAGVVSSLLAVAPDTPLTQTVSVADDRMRTTWQHPGTKPSTVSAETHVQARTALPDERATLAVGPGTPVLVLWRVHRDAGGDATLIERVTALGAAYNLTL